MNGYPSDEEAALEPLLAQSINMGDDYSSIGEAQYHEEKPTSRESNLKKPGKNSAVAAVFNIVACTVGAGILSLPGGVASFGWLSLLLLPFITLSAGFTAKLLIRCMHIVPGKRLNSYREIGIETFGSVGGVITLILQCTTLIGVCTIFLILVGGNMSAVLPWLTFHDIVLIAGVLLIPVSWLKTLREVSFLSYFGVAASVFCALVVLALGLEFAIDDTPKYEVVSTTSGFFLSFNVLVFSYGGHAVLPTVEKDMRTPANFSRVINIAFSIIALMYFSVAAVGYAGWGESLVGGSGNILDAAAVSCDHCVIVSIAYVVISFHVFMAFPIPLNPVNLYLEHALRFHEMPQTKELVCRILLRTGVMVCIIALAMAVPWFGDFLSLVSAISVISMVFVLPILFYVVLSRRHQVHVAWWKMCILVFLFLFGVFASVVGVVFAVRALGCDFATKAPYSNFFVPTSSNQTAVEIARNSSWCTPL